MGTYPTVSLKQAVTKRDEIRLKVTDDIDPSIERKADKFTRASGNTFGEIAIEWHKKHSPAWSKSYAERTFGRINANLVRWNGTTH